MKSKEDTLSTIATELVNSGQQLQEFLGFVNFDRSRDDILQHRNTIVEYLNRTQREIGDLIQRLRSRDIEGFSRARDATVKKLTDRASDLDKATETLGHKLGILAKTIDGDSTDTESLKAQPPPSIPLREIDLHSNPNIEEAIPMLEKFIRESYRDNVGSIRIVHGKGIGVLRNAVRLHLESHKLIKSFGPADKDHGGEGATEAKMVDLSADLL